MTIGERVRQLREKLEMTQEQLAHRLGYKNKSSVAHIENGRDIPRSMVVLLADILQTTPSYLMGWDDETKPYKMPDSSETLTNQEYMMPDSLKKITANGNTLRGLELDVSGLSDKDIEEVEHFIDLLRQKNQSSDSEG